MSQCFPLVNAVAAMAVGIAWIVQDSMVLGLVLVAVGAFAFGMSPYLN